MPNQKKQRVYNQAKHFQHESDWKEYKNLQREVQQLLCHFHQQYITNIMNTSNRSINSKPFWHYIKSKRQDRTGIGTLKSTDGRAVTTPVKKAELLNKQFKSVFTTDNDEICTLRLDNN